VVDANASLGDLIRSLPRLPFFAIHMTPTDQFKGPATPEGAETLRQHLLYLYQLDEDGVLFASGPLDLDPAADRLEGIAIIKAASRDDAERIARDEPYHRAGMRQNTVRTLQLNEGRAIKVARDMLAQA
jgi:hypothetical protein